MNVSDLPADRPGTPQERDHTLPGVKDLLDRLTDGPGRLIEAGSHDELMAANGRFAELFTLQASGYQPRCEGISMFTDINEDPSSVTAPQTGDAFGAMLLAAYARGGLPTIAHEITERDDGHVSVRDAHYYSAPILAGTPDADLLDTVTGRVLDVGCGAGRHLTYLKSRKITALGLDASLGAVQVCARRDLDAVHADIADPPDLGQFDVFLLLGGNLGLLGTPTSASRLLTILGRLASPGARIVAEGIDTSGSGDPIHDSYQDRNLSLGRHLRQITLRIRHRQQATSWLNLWFPSPSELGQIADGTGWRLHEVRPHADGPGYHAEILRDRP